MLHLLEFPKSYFGPDIVGYLAHSKITTLSVIELMSFFLLGHSRRFGKDFSWIAGPPDDLTVVTKLWFVLGRSGYMGSQMLPLKASML